MDGTQFMALRDFTDDINGVEFSADGTLLATAEENRIARVWNLKTGREIARFDEFRIVDVGERGRPLMHVCRGEVSRIDQVERA